MRLTKKQRIQMRLLFCGLLILSWSAYELWVDIKNKDAFDAIHVFVKEEKELDKNASNFNKAYERKQYVIMKEMLEGKLVDNNSTLKVKDFNYMGETLLAALKNVKNEEVKELKQLRISYLEAWAKKSENILQKEQNLLSLKNIDCQYGIYCHYKKAKLKDNLLVGQEDGSLIDKTKSLVKKIDGIN